MERGGVGAQGNDYGKVRLAAEKVFKYSSQTRSEPINGKSFFDDGEICHVRHWPDIKIGKTKMGKN